MNTHTNLEDHTNDFRDLFKQRSEEKEIEHDSFMLMAAFLSEIESIQDEQNMLRKDLAGLIKTSPSYLTQVFRSKKPLNFLTLAKIKRALNIGFEIKAYSKNYATETSVPVYQQIPVRKFAQQFLSEINDTAPVTGSRFEGEYNSTAPQIIRKSNTVLT